MLTFLKGSSESIIQRERRWPLSLIKMVWDLFMTFLTSVSAQVDPCGGVRPVPEPSVLAAGCHSQVVLQDEERPLRGGIQTYI